MHNVPGESKMFTRFVDCGIKSTWSICKTEMLVCQLRANLDAKILFGKITHL